MTRERVQYQCQGCGSVAPRWAGRCGQCGEWNTLEEVAATERRVGAPRRPGPAPGGVGGPVSLRDVPPGADAPRPTGLAELDRVLGGGLVPGSVTLLAGEPGIGKSTLVLQMLAALSRRGCATLLVTAEESAAQIRGRAQRLGLLDAGLSVLAEADLGAVLHGLAAAVPDVVVVDSVQTLSDPATPSAPGTVASVRAVAQALADVAKGGGPAVVLVGHVTKDGSIAGPRALEHLVDTVVAFEGERHHALRVLRAVKHRFGPTGEVGLWEMGGDGLVEVADAGRLLLEDRLAGMPGSVVFAGIEGRRPVLVEVQALVAPGPAGSPPRRAASGYDPGRLGQLLAVLDQRAGVQVGASSVFVSVVGGMRLSDPGADLAVALAVASAVTGRVVADDLVVMGEVGLGGEIRQVPHTARRLAEAVRLGFTRAVTPPAPGAAGIEVVAASTLADALDTHLGRPVGRPRLRALGGSGASPPGPDEAAHGRAVSGGDPFSHVS